MAKVGGRYFLLTSHLTGWSTNDNVYAWRDLMAVDVDTGNERMLLENARIGDIAFNPEDRSLIGVLIAAHTEREQSKRPVAEPRRSRQECARIDAAGEK